MRLMHGRVSIELHTLKSAVGRPLLLLHALGASAGTWPAAALAWSDGPVYALDFAGHGKSGHIGGGAYYPEYFLADADLALEEIAESCVLVGQGVGAYVSVLLAGVRVDQVGAVMLLEGPGFEGGGSLPAHETGCDIEAEGIEGFERFIESASSEYEIGTDPFVAQCGRDLRPLDYVTSYAEAAHPMLFSPRVGREVHAPAWWTTAFDANHGVIAPEDFGDGLKALASLAATRS